MTFIFTQDGTIYQGDPGEQTAEKAEAMEVFNPAEDWMEVEERL